MATWASNPWASEPWGGAAPEPLTPAGVESTFEVLGPVRLVDPYAPGDVAPAGIEADGEVLGPLPIPLPELLQVVRPALIEMEGEVLGPLPDLGPPEPGRRMAAITVPGVTGITQAQVSPAENDKGNATVAALVVPSAGADVAVYVGGQFALGGVVVTSTENEVSEAEHRQTHTATIEGHLREWEKVVVLPDFGGGVTGNVERLGAPVVKTRFLDWTMNGGVNEEDDYSGPKTFGKDVMAAALDPNPANRIDLPDVWPDEFAEWMHATRPGLAPSGWNNFRARTGSAGGPVSFWMANYDYGECWVDGKLLLTCDQAGQSQNVIEELKPGFHLVTIRSHNGGGRAGTLFTAMPLSGGRYGEPILRSSGGWLSSGYVRNPAPLNVGAALIRLVREAKNRGCLTGWTLNFTKDADSNGRPWPAQAESLTVDVGMTMREVLDRFAETLIDFYPSGKNLYVVAKDTGRPGSFPVPWTLGADLTSAGSERSLW